MTTTEPTSTVDVARIPDEVDRLRRTVRQGVTRPIEWREAQLDGIIRFAKEHTEALIDAMEADLGRPRIEGWLADVSSAITEAEYVRKHVAKWAKPRRAKLPLNAMPGSARVVPEPLGVALIIAPWNYPVNLVLEPMTAALAAGNAVALKPSELAPATSSLIARVLPRYLDERAFTVFEGGVDVSTAVLKEQFDHIFFTGSTAVGRIVMRAAAEHLTPVTLELGGKSPVIVADDADLDVAASRIAWGKTFNAGQTCIAPDYVLASERIRDELVDKIAAAWGKFFGPDVAASPDFGRIVNGRHHQRLVDLLDGQPVAVGGGHDADTKFIEPTIVVDPDPTSPLMTDEIFGPILPVLTVDSIDAAIDFVNDRPKPLALYAFTSDDELSGKIMGSTSSGGGCINHTLLHFTPHELPFGGVGPSGMGRYHGQAGFDTFSNLRGILRKPTTIDPPLLYPPYTERKVDILKKLT
jgi:aldehyde dehydrogenase (NAD+)